MHVAQPKKQRIKKRYIGGVLGGLLLALEIVKEGQPLCPVFDLLNPVAGTVCRGVTLTASTGATVIKESPAGEEELDVTGEPYTRELRGDGGACFKPDGGGVGDTFWRPSGYVCTCARDGGWVGALDGGAEGCAR